MPTPTLQNAVPTSADYSLGPRDAAYGDVLVLQPVVLAVHAWDLHVDGCVRCLVVGNSLCYEGQYLRDDVVDLRVRSSSYGTDPHRPLFNPRRRPSPGFSGSAA